MMRLLRATVSIRLLVWPVAGLSVPHKRQLHVGDTVDRASFLELSSTPKASHASGATARQEDGGEIEHDLSAAASLEHMRSVHVSGYRPDVFSTPMNKPDAGAANAIAHWWFVNEGTNGRILFVLVLVLNLLCLCLTPAVKLITTRLRSLAPPFWHDHTPSTIIQEMRHERQEIRSCLSKLQADVDRLAELLTGPLAKSPGRPAPS